MTAAAATLLDEVYVFLHTSRWRARSWSWTAAAATILDEAYAVPHAARRMRGAGAGRLLLPLPYWKRSMRRQVACAELYCLLLLRCSTRSMSSFTPPGGMRGAVAVAAAAATVLDEAYAFLRAAASWWPGQLLALAGNPTPAPFLHAAASPSKLFSVIIVWSVEYHLRP